MKIQKLIIALMFGLCSVLSAQQHYIQVVFSEPMDRPTVLNKSNWTVSDSNLKEVKINKIGVAEGDSIVVLYTEFLAYKSGYTVRVENVTDKAGNPINENNSAWFYFNGYDPMQHRPYLMIKK